jgi:hypothetical protein
MRNIIFVALIIALATVVGCKEKSSAPAESAPAAMSSAPAEQPKDQMEQAPATTEAPAEAPADAPAGGEAAPK